MKMTVIKLLRMIYYFITEFESENICKGKHPVREREKCVSKREKSWDRIQNLIKLGLMYPILPHLSQHFSSFGTTKVPTMVQTYCASVMWLQKNEKLNQYPQVLKFRSLGTNNTHTNTQKREERVVKHK